MAEFMLHHTHPAEECENIFPQLQNVAQSLKGKNFFCVSQRRPRRIFPGGGW